MPGATVDLGTGTTITFGTSAFTAELLSIAWSGLARESVDVAHMGTPAPGAGKLANRPFLTGDIISPGVISGTWHFNPDSIPPIDQPAETITITFPLVAGDTTPATWAASGSLISYEPDVPLEDKMTCSFEIQLSGEITITAAT